MQVHLAADAPHQAAIRAALIAYSRANTYVASQFADAVCSCGGREFQLEVDESAGAAVRYCAVCGDGHAIGDSEDYLADAEVEPCFCLCGSPIFEITVGVALYADSDDVRWLYLGCRCPGCGVVGCYADWKNEFTGHRALLALV